MQILALLLLLLVVVAAVTVLAPSLVIRLVLAPLSARVLGGKPSIPLIFSGSASQPRLALTIDDGPSGTGSDRLLDLLRQLEVPATFFLIGSHLERNPGFARRALEQGHELGHHHWLDERSACLDQGAFHTKWRQTEQKILRFAKPLQPELRWFRPGGGFVHSAMLEWVSNLGYQTVLGSIWPWDTFRPPGWFQRWLIRSNAHPGGIIVLHDTRELTATTLATLAGVLPHLKKRGFRFVTLTELLNADDRQGGATLVSRQA